MKISARSKNKYGLFVGLLLVSLLGCSQSKSSNSSAPNGAQNSSGTNNSTNQSAGAQASQLSAQPPQVKAAGSSLDFRSAVLNSSLMAKGGVLRGGGYKRVGFQDHFGTANLISISNDAGSMNLSNFAGDAFICSGSICRDPTPYVVNRLTPFEFYIEENIGGRAGILYSETYYSADASALELKYLKLNILNLTAERDYKRENYCYTNSNDYYLFSSDGNLIHVGGASLIVGSQDFKYGPGGEIEWFKFKVEKTGVCRGAVCDKPGSEGWISADRFSCGNQNDYEVASDVARLAPGIDPVSPPVLNEGSGKPGSVCHIALSVNAGFPVYLIQAPPGDPSRSSSTGGGLLLTGQATSIIDLGERGESVSAVGLQIPEMKVRLGDVVCKDQKAEKCAPKGAEGWIQISNTTCNTSGQ